MPFDSSRMAEAPGSRTQPPRVSGERPILKTGRAAGPRSLPEPGKDTRCLTFDQAYVARSGAFLGVLRSEFDSLTFTQQFEHGPANRAPVEKVFDPALVPNEPEAFVDEQPCNCPGWHKRRLRSPNLASQAELEFAPV